MHRIEIDRFKCKKHTHCIKVSSDIWRMDSQGRPVFVAHSGADSLHIDDSLLESAKKSALVCPEYAIDVKDANGNSVLGIEPDKKEVRTIKAHYDSMKEWVMDSKGFFTIKPFPDEGVIRVRYYNEKHQLTLVIEGKTAIEIYNTIVREKLISRLDHAADIGAELMKAEIAMRLGANYVQDSPLELRK